MSDKAHEHHGRRLATVKELAATPGYNVFSESAIRHQIFNSEPRIASNGEVLAGNGLAEFGAILRVNRKVLIDLDRYDTWLDAHRVGAE